MSDSSIPSQADTPEEMVGEFHAAFGHPTHHMPCWPRRKRILDRIEWVRSELVEMEEAILEGSFSEFLDAAGDARYFNDGFFVEAGVDGNVVSERIHHSNLLKLWPAGLSNEVIDETLAKYGLTQEDVSFHTTSLEGLLSCKRNVDDKVVKGPNFKEPDFSDIQPCNELDPADPADERDPVNQVESAGPAVSPA